MESESKGWQKVYDQNPDIYNTFADATDPDDNILISIEGITSFDDKTVLDIGTGTGKYAFKLCRRAKQVIGVDKCSTSLELARKKQIETGTGNLEFILEDVSDLDYRNFFDVALSAWALNAPWDGNYQQLERALRTAMNTIKKKGWFFIVTTPPGELAGEIGKYVFDEEKLNEHFSHKKRFVDYLKGEFGFDGERVRSGWRFNSVDDAYACFGTIYGKEAGDYVLSRGKWEIESSSILLSRQI